MTWHVPVSWVRVDRPIFDRALETGRDWKRSGWSGFVVYCDEPTKREFAAVQASSDEGGESYWLHPDVANFTYRELAGHSRWPALGVRVMA